MQFKKLKARAASILQNNQNRKSHSQLQIVAALKPVKALKPFNKIFLLTVQGGTSFVDHLCYLCLVFVMLSRLLIAALWSPAGKGLTSNGSRL